MRTPDLRLRWTAAERFCALADIPVPPPMSGEQRRGWEAKQDRADVEVLRLSNPDSSA